MFIDEFGGHVDLNIEEMSRNLCQEYIKEDDTVLEMGARYGTVSVFISKQLNGKRLAAVEPDPHVIYCLEKNMKSNNADFHIIHGIVSNTPSYVVHHPCIWEQKTYTDVSKFNNRQISTVKNYSVADIENILGSKINVLVADCEGFLIQFFNENKEFIKNLDTIIYEEDCTKAHPINGDYVEYTELENFLTSNGFTLKKDLVDAIGLHNKVYSKRDI